MTLNHVLSRECSSKRAGAALFLLLLLTVFTAPARAAQLWQPLAQIIDPELDEISGIAPSRLRGGVYWVHNDSLSAEALYAINEQGTVLQRVQISGAPNLDWEDIASYTEQGRAYLAVADIGNNLSFDADLNIYVFAEPAAGVKELRPEKIFRFRYADGPRDAESLAVDLQRRRFLIADKRRDGATIYALPMESEAHIAQAIAELPTTALQAPPPVRSLLASGDDYVTSMDLSADGRRLLVLTYRNLLYFERAPDEDWRAVLARKPRGGWRLPPSRGFEAVCWSADGRRALVIPEGKQPRLYAAPVYLLWEPAAAPAGRKE